MNKVSSSNIETQNNQIEKAAISEYDDLFADL